MKRKSLKKLLIILFSVVFVLVALLTTLTVGVSIADSSWEHVYADEAKQDISPILQKANLTDEEYQMLYRQTGLTKIGIDDLRKRGKIQQLLILQNAFLKQQTVHCRNFAPFTYTEEILGYMPLTSLKNGDILVSSSMHVSFLRYGHAALVVDAQKGDVLEIAEMGSLSGFDEAIDFCDRANFMVLRPNLPQELIDQVVENAKTNLTDIPYDATVGVLSPKFATKPTGTQCAHLVWYAYKQFGIDLDSDGGAVVRPKDIANSPYLQVVQVFGFDLEELWK